MSVFCIDVGNTSTHFAVLERGSLIEEGRVGTHDLASASTLISMAERNKVRGIAFSSVVPRVTSLLKAELREVKCPSFSLKPQYCNGLNITAKNPHLIGQDLLANAIGAQKYYGEPVIIVDMGTATTLNPLTKALGFECGVIAPGFQMLADALHEKTALLPPLTPEHLSDLPEGLGGSTIECMQIGCILGYQGLLDALLERAKKYLATITSEEPRIVCTGGNSRFFAKNWENTAIFDYNLTLKGLEEAFNRQYT
jgi:type III pantothenate kinase